MKIESQIEHLTATINNAVARRASMQESVDLAQNAVNVCLRLFNEDPTPKQQVAVDKAELRLADARKSLHTSDSATDIARQDLVALKEQQREESIKRFEDRVAEHRKQLNRDTDTVIDDLLPLVLKMVEIGHFCDGIDPSIQDIGKMIGYRVFGGEMRKKVVDHITSVQNKLRSEVEK